MEPSLRLVLVLCFLVLPSVILADTNTNDTSGLLAMAQSWDKQLASWSGNNPCGENSWTGIDCTGNRVTSIKLGNLELSGTLSGDIQFVQELQHLDLSYNVGLHGPLPLSIGNLSNLQNLILVGCSFSGEIPKELGQLTKLRYLSLNNNKFRGSIPRSLGGIPDLYWLDLGNNLLTGELPVSNGTDPGLDNLTDAKHFHLGANNLSGSIPIQIFKSELNLIHLLLDHNEFSGSIPPELGLLDKLEVLRLDSNHQLTGPIPASISNLTHLEELHLENNNFTGPLPDLSGIPSLVYVDMSNNSFNNSVNESIAPAWFTTMPSLTSLFLENLHIPGHLPQSLFNLSAIQTLRLRGNNFSGRLEIGPYFSPELQLIDLQDNQITGYTMDAPNYDKKLILVGNPVCDQSSEAYCTSTWQSTNKPAPRPYSTALNCPDDQQPSTSTTCLPPDQDLSPGSCVCAVPYRGTLSLRAPAFSDTSNASYKYFTKLENDMKVKFTAQDVPVDSVSIKGPYYDEVNNMKMSLEVFPSGKPQFSARDISELSFLLSNQTYKPPHEFGPYFFIGQHYPLPDEFKPPSEPKASHKALIIGVSVGSVVLAAATILALLVIFRVVPVPISMKRQPKQTESLVSWDINSTSASIPQLRGVRMFTFEELKKITCNFSEANDIGKGGYGKVYRGTMPSGQLVAVKRSQQGSLQGSLEFRTEIELLSRVHHKNVVSLVGFCLDQGEQMLVYEYVANGTLKESLTGMSGVRLDWKRRLRVLLGTAKGISYLHELADPPIVHRDIKSSNVLLDDRLNAKVSDFGLSKPLPAGHGRPWDQQVTTQVKGTMGYMDPEYYMTQQLTEKSDVYSFGVLMLELITARKPLERGRYIVREVKAALDRTKDLYGLHELLDPVLVATSPSGIAGLELFVDLALRCVEEAGADRPSMAEAVGEIERVVKAAAAGAGDSASNSSSLGNSRTRHPYAGDSLSDYSGGGMPSIRVEPK